MTSVESRVSDSVAGHEARNAVLRSKLIELGVNPDVPRDIDLHFFLPSVEAGRAFSEALGLRAVVMVDVAPPHSAGQDASVTVTVFETVSSVTARPYVEFLVRAAIQHKGVHDGWGTSVEATSSTP